MHVYLSLLLKMINGFSWLMAANPFEKKKDRMKEEKGKENKRKEKKRKNERNLEGRKDSAGMQSRGWSLEIEGRKISLRNIINNCQVKI